MVVPGPIVGPARWLSLPQSGKGWQTAAPRHARRRIVDRQREPARRKGGQGGA
ncbi:MAG: hypothetical protein OZSIB_3643 [Candidatus Ozemobacter sibiricus]|uniref:Uncharacterized protein n=1 Tax=Candidatus Ozemobacter sibiricus TaxID=2268124 RepID=A0A367ZQW8_9BACT|nr:MAG: hypothetical protein OZSIB_3643 [Candidatus Ozemobacter sibiricus]